MKYKHIQVNFMYSHDYKALHITRLFYCTTLITHQTAWWYCYV